MKPCPDDIELDHRGPWIVAWRGVVARIPDADMQECNRVAGRCFREQERDDALFDEARRVAGVRAIERRLAELSDRDRLTILKRDRD